jgi:hypothetical protein
MIRTGWSGGTSTRVSWGWAAIHACRNVRMLVVDCDSDDGAVPIRRRLRLA